MATGSYAPNFHDGSRSEYLAQYVFSGFGPSVPVPHQEDHGIDLFCTLSERKGSRAWPVAYYSVQVKSTDEPWIFSGPKSVEWFLGYPAPLLLCIVDKKLAAIRVYQTVPRFQAAVMMVPPKSITLNPGIPGKGRVVNWSPKGELAGSDGVFSLSAPILQFTVSDLMSDEQFKVFADTLRFWIFQDLANIHRLQAGMRATYTISRYRTNIVPANENIVRFEEMRADVESRATAEVMLWEQLDWLSMVMLGDNDRVGALLVTLLMRHLQLENSQIETDLFRPGLYRGLRSNGALDAAMGTTDMVYPFAPFDKLLKELRQKFASE
jgi:hypothetical protein